MATTIYGNTRKNRQFYITVSWPTIPLGATSLELTVKSYLGSGDNISDVVNTYNLTTAGTSSSGSNVSLSGTGTFLIHTQYKTVTISQTTTTSVSVSGYLKNVEYLAGDMTASGNVSIPASGVPSAHPTSIANSSTYNFARTGGTTNTVTFVATGGLDWDVSGYAAMTYPTISGFGNIVCVKSNQNIYLKLSNAQIDYILDYWNDSNTVSTLTFSIITTATGLTNKTWTGKTLSVPAIQTLYSISAFSASRGIESGGSTPVYLSATLSAAAASPWRQASGSAYTWPDFIPVKYSVGSSSTAVSMTESGTGIYTRTYDATAASTLSINSTQYYTAYEYVGSTKYDSIVRTVPVLASFLSFDKVTANTGYLGINNGAPIKALDVIGDANIEGAFTVCGQPVLTLLHNVACSDQTLTTSHGDIQYRDVTALSLEYTPTEDKMLLLALDGFGYYTASVGGFTPCTFRIRNSSTADSTSGTIRTIPTVMISTGNTTRQCLCNALYHYSVSANTTYYFKVTTEGDSGYAYVSSWTRFIIYEFPR